jgi:hypothetical protein
MAVNQWRPWGRARGAAALGARAPGGKGRQNPIFENVSILLPETEL